ncbi:MAG: UTP--glucose-phosphate uridylyltransferase [Actinomycetota bacterium]|jgi:UTP--glucose-1-phosphate uridylyltransferase
MSKVTCAVVPVAGYGTRFLPATKATPKEMLPVVDKPAIQYVVEEAVAAGLNDVLFITGRSKRALEDHFDDSPELEAELSKQNKSELLEKVKDPAELAKIHFVRQGVPKGLGHAVSMAKEHVGTNPFAVLLGDDLIDPRDFVLDDMLKVQAEHGGSVVLLMEVDPSEIHLYGSAQVEKTDKENVVKVTDLVEKPNANDAPSNYAVIGRYLFDPAVFDVLEKTKPGKNGEIQLTDAMKTLAKDVKKEVGGGLHAVIFKGRRYDTGDKLSYLQSVVQLAAERDDLGPAFKKWLKNFVNNLGN